VTVLVYVVWALLLLLAWVGLAVLLAPLFAWLFHRQDPPPED